MSKSKLPKFESIGEVFGFINIEITRQRGWVAWLTPILLGGLYNKSLESLIIKAFHYWYFALPVWIGLTLFDLFVLIPGEQNFYHKRSKVLSQILKKGD